MSIADCRCLDADALMSIADSRLPISQCSHFNLLELRSSMNATKESLTELTQISEYFKDNIEIYNSISIKNLRKV